MTPNDKWISSLFAPTPKAEARFWADIAQYVKLDRLSSEAPDLPAEYKTWSECYDHQIRHQGPKHLVLLESPYRSTGENWTFTICRHSDLAVLINREWQNARKSN